MSRPPLLTRVERARKRLPANVRKLGWISLANDAASELAYPIVPLFPTGARRGAPARVGPVARVTRVAPGALGGLMGGVAEAIATGVPLVSGWVSDGMGDRRKPWIVGGY